MSEVHTQVNEFIGRATEIAGDRIPKFSEEESQRVAKRKLENIDKPNQRDGRIISTDTLFDRWQSIVKSMAQENALAGQDGSRILDKLETDAKEKMSVESVGDGFVKAEKTALAHQRVEAHTRSLVNHTIESIVLDTSGATEKVIAVDWSADAKKNGIDLSRVDARTLKESPAFENYRRKLARRMEELAQEVAPMSIREGLRSPKQFAKNLWSRAKLQSKYIEIFMPSNTIGKKDLLLQLDNARSLSAEKQLLGVLPSLDVARSFLQDYGKLLNRAGVVINNKQVVDAMSAEVDITNFLETHQGKIDTEISSVWDEAHAQNKAINLQREQSAVGERLSLEREAWIKQIEEVAHENEARQEMSDLELQAKQLQESADRHAELASMGLTALSELQHSQGKIAEFNEQLKSGKLPESLQGIINSDMGVELDEFVRTGGKKGSVEAVRQLIGSWAKEGELEKVIFNRDNPDGFLTLSTLQEGSNRVVETGITATLAEDGTWQFRFATRKGGTVNINQDIPVVNLRPEGIFTSLATIDAQETSLAEAKKALAGYQEKYEAAIAIKATSAETRKRYKGLIASSTRQVDDIKRVLASSKKELAEQLKTTNADKTLGGAFTEMAKAQKEVAEAFYSEDFREMVTGLAEELKMAPDKVTAEVLATLVVEARNASNQAADMAEYFEVVKTPGALEAKVIDGRLGEIDDLATQFARLQRQEAIVAGLDEGPAKAKAAQEHAKERRKLDKDAGAFGEIINADFIAAVPAPLRKGTRAVTLSDARLKQQVRDILSDAGFDAGKYLKRDGAAAMKAHESLPYASEVQSLIIKSADALVVIDGAEATQVLRKALQGGDVAGFLEQAQAIKEHLTNEKFGAMQVETNAQMLAELLKTPEGIARALETGELTIGGAVDAIITGEANTGDIMEALRTKLEATREEAARRMAKEIAKLDTRFDPATEADPLAGRDDVVAMAQFIQKQSLGQFNEAYWRGLVQRASAEKKTIVAEG